AVAFAPDRSVVATGHDDGVVRVWDVATRKAVNEFAGHKGPVSALAFRGDGEVLATAGEDCLIFLWDVHRQAPPGTAPRHTDPLPPPGRPPRRQPAGLGRLGSPRPRLGPRHRRSLDPAQQSRRTGAGPELQPRRQAAGL